MRPMHRFGGGAFPLRRRRSSGCCGRALAFPWSLTGDGVAAVPELDQEEEGVVEACDEDPATGDFPSAERPYLIQAIERCSSGGAPLAASGSSSTSGSGGPVCNISFSLDLYVRAWL